MLFRPFGPSCEIRNAIDAEFLIDMLEEEMMTLGPMDTLSSSKNEVGSLA